MNFLIFIGALSLSIFTFELLSAVQQAAVSFGGRRVLTGVTTGSMALPTRRSTWDALLLAMFPQRFDPSQAKNMVNVIDMLRRAGYPYDTPGEFYAASMRTFSIYLAVGGLLAGALVWLGIPVGAPIAAAMFILLGLRRPYVRLKMLAKKRAETMRNNMLIGLSMMISLITSGLQVQDSLRRASVVGGPFCNLLGLMAARLDIGSSPGQALDIAEAHLPDPSDIEMSLFVRDIRDHFTSQRPLLSSLTALRESVHRMLIESTEARAALVRQRAGLFGILSVMGLIFSLVSPFMGVF